MSKQTFPLVLHIVQKDETLETIAKKYHTTMESILLLNPLLRIKQFIPGQPINIFEKQNEPTERENETVVYDQVDVTYLTKESISAKIFYPEAFSSLTKIGRTAINQIVTGSRLFKEVTPISELIAIFQKIYTSIFDFIEIIKNKNVEEIKAFQSTIEKIYDQLNAKISSILRNTSLDYYIKNMFKLWQLYILKVLTLKFDEAQEVFYQILERTKNLSIKKT